MRYNQELYETLSKLRLQLAQQAKLPAFAVFSNRTLVHMCEVRPDTKEAFLNIHGVGPVKLEKYGQLFLEAIEQYCKEKEDAAPKREEITTGELAPLLEKMLDFYHRRDWEQFHSPKNLVMNLASEMGELIELFRWLTEEQSYQLDPETLEAARDEIGDVFTSLLYLAHKLGIDPIEASTEKLVKMEKKYPVHTCRGKSLKYTHYE